MSTAAQLPASLPATDDTCYVQQALEEFNFWRRLVNRFHMDDPNPRLRVGQPAQFSQLSVFEQSMVLMRAQQLKAAHRPQQAPASPAVHP